MFICKDDKNNFHVEFSNKEFKIFLDVVNLEEEEWSEEHFSFLDKIEKSISDGIGFNATIKKRINISGNYINVVDICSDKKN